MADTVDTVYPFQGRRLVHQMVIFTVALVPLLLTGLAVALLFGSYVTWLHVGLMLGMWAFSGLGISVGFHRLLAHQAFRTSAPVRFILLMAGTMALQGGPATWAATHRRHHALSDKEGDPHSPLDGLWHAHFGWLPKGRLVDQGPAHERLMRDPVVAFLEKTHLLWMTASFIIPGLIALAVTPTLGSFWLGVLWGGAVRVFVGHHVTWSINSICHVIGTRPYESGDQARNVWLFGWIGFGEGWHNNHHAFPKSAWLGHRWYQFDLGKYLIVTLRAFRLVNNVYVPPREERQARKRSRAVGGAGKAGNPTRAA